ncbi:gluconate 2-dehydrogenase subunit 3 family protein [Halorarum salinum]|uniref:Gluconate 2-dehydrogenase subunit 3 family protein n=1 Tax=Halorarum salinum TaxID=2743089 RepID=A0A7D5QDQ6_9EURY|nr:gluconate 2-dehydrogenase subunit 3 family protein [Halobaculum salinum]QLG63879.1 gluconate 2-dehydrogenase subunit 3 family protein [Halobaculum salinum]
MKLTRRDALAALGVGSAGAAGAFAWEEFDPGAAGGSNGSGVNVGGVLVAVAEVVYPSAVEGVPEFVETYVVGRAVDGPAYASGVREAAATLDAYAENWFDAPVAELSAGDRDALLRQMGVETAAADPEGTDPERVRRYVVNELQYALYTSPTGGELVGIENPQGHPGGIESYRRGPEP